MSMRVVFSKQLLDYRTANHLTQYQIGRDVWAVCAPVSGTGTGTFSATALYGRAHGRSFRSQFGLFEK